MRFLSAGHKIAIYMAPKCGSRTVIGLICYSHDPSIVITHPEWFLPNMVVMRGQYRKLEIFMDSHPPYGNFHNREKVKAEINVCIKRDPLKRLISGYTNRVLFHHDIPYREEPTFDEFIQKFDYYMDNPIDAVQQLKRHFYPQSNMIGKHPSLYDHVYETEQMEDLVCLFEEVYQKPFPRLHLQQGGNQFQAAIQVEDSHRKFVKERYRRDYDSWFPDL
jgi:hypothetical protein